MIDISILSDFTYNSEVNKNDLLEELESGEKFYIRLNDYVFGLSWSFIRNFPSIYFYTYAVNTKETNSESNPFPIQRDFTLFSYILVIMLTDCQSIKESINILTIYNIYESFLFYFPNHIYKYKEDIIFQSLFTYLNQKLMVLNVDFTTVTSYSGPIYEHRYNNKKHCILLDDTDDINTYRDNKNWFEIVCNRQFNNDLSQMLLIYKPILDLFHIVDVSSQGSMATEELSILDLFNKEIPYLFPYLDTYSIYFNDSSIRLKYKKEENTNNYIIYYIETNNITNTEFFQEIFSNPFNSEYEQIYYDYSDKACTDIFMNLMQSGAFPKQNCLCLKKYLNQEKTADISDYISLLNYIPAKNIETIDLSFSPFPAYDLKDFLSILVNYNLSNLKTFIMTSSVIDNDIIKLLMVFFDKISDTIQTIDIANNFYATDLTEFYTLMDKQFFPQLQLLNISNTCHHDVDIPYLNYCLRHNYCPHYTGLLLANASISAVSVDILTNLLKENYLSKLTTITFIHCTFPEIQMLKFIQLLDQNTQPYLQVIDMTFNSLTDTLLEGLFKQLSTNYFPFLCELYINNNKNITCKTFYSVFKSHVLSILSQIQRINFSFNNLSDIACIAFLSAYKGSTANSLNYLNLESTNITDTTLDYLSTLIRDKTFPQLNELVLSGNKFTFSYMKRFAKSFTNNNLPSMKKITIINCSLAEREKSKCKKLFANSEISNSKSLRCDI